MAIKLKIRLPTEHILGRNLKADNACDRFFVDFREFLMTRDYLDVEPEDGVSIHFDINHVQVREIKDTWSE